MNEATLIKDYLAKLVKNNPSALNLNDDVFFDKKNKNVISIDTYVEKIHFPNFGTHLKPSTCRTNKIHFQVARMC